MLDVFTAARDFLNDFKTPAARRHRPETGRQQLKYINRPNDNDDRLLNQIVAFLCLFLSWISWYLSFICRLSTIRR